MDLLTGLVALLIEYHEEDECDCEGAGTCRECLTRVALGEASARYPAEYTAAGRVWWRHMEARFAPPAQAATPRPEALLVMPAGPAAEG